MGIVAIPQFLFDPDGQFRGECGLPLGEFQVVEEQAGLIPMLLDLMRPSPDFQAISTVRGWTPVILRCLSDFLFTQWRLLPEGSGIGSSFSFVDLGGSAEWLEAHLVKAEPDLAKFPAHLETIKTVCRWKGPRPSIRTVCKHSWPERGRALAFAEWAWAQAAVKFADEVQARLSAEKAAKGESEGEGLDGSGK